MEKNEYAVVLVEDDAMVRSWVTQALGSTAFVVCAAFESIGEAPAEIERCRPPAQGLQ